MRKRRYTEVQIVAILKELDAGRPDAELARKHGVHVNTLRLWRSKYGGLDVSDLSRLKELESENSQMERIIARQALEIRAMSEVIPKRVGPSACKAAVRALRVEGLSERQACRLAHCPRPTVRYKPCKAPDDELVRDRLRCIAQERPRFGWRRLKILLRREGIVMNHKRLRRLYCDERLQVRPRRKRRVRLVRGNVSPPPTRINEEWGLDFMHEYLMTKRKVRLLTIEDRFTREGLALDPDFSLSSRRVIRTLDDIAEVRGYPGRLRVDNGPENVAGATLQWSIRPQCAAALHRSGKARSKRVD